MRKIIEDEIENDYITNFEFQITHSQHASNYNKINIGNSIVINTRKVNLEELSEDSLEKIKLKRLAPNIYINFENKLFRYRGGLSEYQLILLPLRKSKCRNNNIINFGHIGKNNSNDIFRFDILFNVILFNKDLYFIPDSEEERLELAKKNYIFISVINDNNQKEIFEYWKDDIEAIRFFISYIHFLHSDIAKQLLNYSLKKEYANSYNAYTDFVSIYENLFFSDISIEEKINYFDIMIRNIKRYKSHNNFIKIIGGDIACYFNNADPKATIALMKKHRKISSNIVSCFHFTEFINNPKYNDFFEEMINVINKQKISYNMYQSLVQLYMDFYSNEINIAIKDRMLTTLINHFSFDENCGQFEYEIRFYATYAKEINAMFEKFPKMKEIFITQVLENENLLRMMNNLYKDSPLFFEIFKLKYDLNNNE